MAEPLIAKAEAETQKNAETPQVDNTPRGKEPKKSNPPKQKKAETPQVDNTPKGEEEPKKSNPPVFKKEVKDEPKADLEEKGPGKSPKMQNYYPLQVGNQWTYQLNVNGKTQTMASKITKFETISQVKLARLEAEVGGNVGQTEHLQQTDKGIFRHRSNGLEVTPPLVLMKYPFKAGEKWGGDFTALGQKAKYTCEAGEETVEVVAGKFKTARIIMNVEQNGLTIGTTYWFAENVGFVKQTVDLNGINILAELQRFELKD